MRRRLVLLAAFDAHCTVAINHAGRFLPLVHEINEGCAKSALHSDSPVMLFVRQTQSGRLQFRGFNANHHRIRRAHTLAAV